MQRSDLVIFCVFGSLSSVIYGPVHLFSTSCGLKVLIKKGLIKNLFREKSRWNSCLFYGYASLQSGKLLQTTYHRRSTYRYAKARIEWVKIAKSISRSNQFFLNWLFSWGFGKDIFSLNRKEKWNKELHRSKKKFNV